jgi:cytochrome c553
MNKQWGLAMIILPAIFSLVIVAFVAVSLLVQPAPPPFVATLTPTYDPTTIQILNRSFDGVQIAEGRAIFAQYCATCHGIDARGQFPDAPLEPAFKDQLSAEQVLTVIAYIKTLWTPQQRIMQRQLTEDEERLFAGT